MKPNRESRKTKELRCQRAGELIDEPNAESMLRGHRSLLAAIAYAMALLQSFRLVRIISHSGHL